MDQLKTICAGCKVVIREGSPDKDGAVSHGLCPKCQPIYFPATTARTAKGARSAATIGGLR